MRIAKAQGPGRTGYRSSCAELPSHSNGRISVGTPTKVAISDSRASSIAPSGLEMINSRFIKEGLCLRSNDKFYGSRARRCKVQSGYGGAARCVLGWCVDTVANASFHPHVLVIDEVDYLTCGPGATTVAPTGRTPSPSGKSTTAFTTTRTSSPLPTSYQKMLD